MESDKHFVKIFARLDELERRVRNLLIAGCVVGIHPDGKMIDVGWEERTTGWIRWFATAAGEIADYRCPSIGEQCLLLNYGGGEDSTQAWALCGVPCDKFPLPGEGDPALRVTVYKEGVKQTIDVAGNVGIEVQTAYQIETPGSFKVSATESADLITDGVATIKAAEQVLLDTPDAHGTGEVSDQKRSMSADRGIYDSHKHKEQGDGAPTSPPDKTQG